MLTFEYDEYIQNEHDQGRPVWIVKLNNGQTVYQDDGRFLEYSTSAWIRLANYVKENSLQIESIELDFRGVKSTVLSRQSPSQRFYYAKRMTSVAGGMTMQEVGIGMTSKDDDNTINILWHLNPSLELVDVSQRPAGDDEWLI